MVPKFGDFTNVYRIRDEFAPVADQIRHSRGLGRRNDPAPRERRLRSVIPHGHSKSARGPRLRFLVRLAVPRRYRNAQSTHHRHLRCEFQAWEPKWEIRRPAIRWKSGFLRKAARHPSKFRPYRM